MRAVAQLQARGDVVQHALDRPLAERELPRDLAGVETLGHQPEHVDLAVAQPREPQAARREDLAAWGRELYAKLKGDPQLASIPVVGPSLIRFDSPELLGDQAAFLDWESIQPYTGARSPTAALNADERRHIRPVSGA